MAVDPNARRSGVAGAAAVAVTLGLTELFAGMFAAVPSATAAIGSVIVDRSPPWLKEFAISVFGTADKLVLAIGTFVVAITIGYVLGRRSSGQPTPIVVGFVGFGIVGALAQTSEPNAAVVPSIVAMSVAVAVGVGVFLVLRSWFEPLPEGAEYDYVDFGRRRMMVGVAAAATATVVSVGVGRAMLRSRADAQRASLDLPTPVEIAADPTISNDFGLPGVVPAVVGNATFYRIDTALVVPAVDPDHWSVRVHGMVDDEVVLSYQDLQGMPLIERYATLSCVSNEVGGRLVGNALWTGVLLRDVLDMAGVHPEADQLVGRSVDGWTAGFPTELAFDDREAMIAIGMNREVLPAAHGFPARLVVPGLYGYVSATKWLTEIELTTLDAFDGYWIPRGWSKDGPIKTQSRIDRPKRRETVPVGPYTFGGVAWAPTVGITDVEIRIDRGPWMRADLAEPLSTASWVLWKADTTLEAGPHEVTVRATDTTGAVQTERFQPPAPDGATGWHTVQFSAA